MIEAITMTLIAVGLFLLWYSRGGFKGILDSFHVSRVASTEQNKLVKAIADEMERRQNERLEEAWKALQELQRQTGRSQYILVNGTLTKVEPSENSDEQN